MGSWRTSVPRFLSPREEEGEKHASHNLAGRSWNRSPEPGDIAVNDRVRATPTGLPLVVQGLRNGLVRARFRLAGRQDFRSRSS
jgi:hypothetical protein